MNISLGGIAILTAVLAVLKAAGLLPLPWIWVFAPLMIVLGIAIVALFIAAFAVLSAWIGALTKTAEINIEGHELRSETGEEGGTAG